MSESNKDILSHYIGLRHGYQFRETDFTEDGIQVIKIGNVTDDGLNLEADVSFVSAERIKEFENITIADGDILMSLTGNIGRVVEAKNLNGRILFQNYRVGVFYPLNELVFKPFIKWIFSSEEISKQLSSHSNQSAQANFGKQDLDKLKFKIPNYSEQQSITKILSTADAVIEKTHAAIAKYKAIKQGMLQDLFTRGIDLETGKLRPRYEDAPELYKESKLGMISREWDCEKLEKLSSLITKGESPNWQGFNYQETGILFVTSENVRDGEMDIVNNKKFIPFEFHEKLERSQLKKDDVLINLVGASIARSAHYNFDFPANINQAVALVRLVSSELNVTWFASYLQFHECIKRLLGEQVETARANLSLNNLRMFLVAKPPVEEQEKIAERLKAIDNKLQTEQTYLQKMQSLKKGLMEDLLSGRKQVKVAEENINAIAHEQN